MIKSIEREAKGFLLVFRQKKISQKKSWHRWDKKYDVCCTCRMEQPNAIRKEKSLRGRKSSIMSNAIKVMGGEGKEEPLRN